MANFTVRDVLTARVGSYRAAADVERIVDRLVANGVALAQLEDAVSHEVALVHRALRLDALRAGTLTVNERVQVALLAEERGAALRADLSAASQVRYAAIASAAEDEPIVGLANRLGISRQKVSQIVKNSPMRASVDGMLSGVLRTVRGER